MLMKQKIIYLFFSAIALSAILFFIPGCHKQEIWKPNDFISISKDWFQNTIINNEKEMLSVSYSVLPKNAPERLFARMQKIEKILNWGNAKQYSLEGIKFVITPIDEDIKPFQNKSFEAARCLIFYQDKSGGMHMNVEEVLSDRNNSLGNDIPVIMKTGFENMYFNKRQNTMRINATAIFYDEKYYYKSSFKITNGSFSKNKFLVENKKSPAQKRQITTLTPTTSCSDDCQTWYIVGTWYYLDTGEIIDQEIVGEYQTGNCNSDEEAPPSGAPPPPPEPCDETSEEAQQSLVTMSGSELFQTSISSGGSQTTINGIITEPRTPKWPFYTINMGFGSTPEWSANFTAVRYKNNTTDTWKWQSFNYANTVQTGGTTPPCMSATMNTTVSSTISGDKLSSSVTLTYDLEVTISCLGGTEVGPPHTNTLRTTFTASQG